MRGAAKRATRPSTANLTRDATAALILTDLTVCVCARQVSAGVHADVRWLMQSCMQRRTRNERHIDRCVLMRA